VCVGIALSFAIDKISRDWPDPAGLISVARNNLHLWRR
jgi:hypothetical protein